MMALIDIKKVSKRMSAIQNEGKMWKKTMYIYAEDWRL